MTRIKINNITVSIGFVDKIDTNENALGIFYTDAPQILVLKSLVSSNKKLTLIHELTHDFIWFYGYNTVNLAHEDVCNFIGCYGQRIIDYANKILAKEKKNDKNKN